MLTINLKHTIRNLSRKKLYSFINIFGLALGIAAFLLILQYVSFERSINGFHKSGYTDNQNAFRQFRFNAIDTDFLTAMGLRVIKGRPFSKDNPSDSNAILVNEALVLWKSAAKMNSFTN